MKRFTTTLATVAIVLATTPRVFALREAGPMEQPVSYRTVTVEGVSIFYREAGPKGAPTILLLHGLPSSSRMFQPLLTRLADRYHLIAPDYPGFGHSDWPDPKHFAYTFDHIAQLMDGFTQALGLSHYTLYMQDYGGPVGFRMALAHPERLRGLVVQDAVAHNEGLGANWATRRAFWTDRPTYEEALRKNLLSLATTRTRHIGDDPDVELYDPDLWTDEYAFLNAPGQAQIQSDLFYDYLRPLPASCRTLPLSLTRGRGACFNPDHKMARSHAARAITLSSRLRSTTITHRMLSLRAEIAAHSTRRSLFLLVRRILYSDRPRCEVILSGSHLRGAIDPHLRRAEAAGGNEIHLSRDNYAAAHLR